jgi:ribose transport system substrate-binding protein
MNKSTAARVCAASAAGVLAMSLAGCASSSAGSAGGNGKLKIALNLSTTNNEYQTEARNLIEAASKTPPYKDKVELRIDVAGVDVPRQIQTINNEVAAGYKAILLYPASATALNPAIQSACNAGVTVIAWDSTVTAPCAYNVSVDVTNFGYTGAKWLVDKMGGKGNLMVIRGIPGVSGDELEYAGVKKAIAGTQVKIVAEPVGKWAVATIKTAFAEAYAAHPNIDAVWGATGCVQVAEVTHNKPIYCAGGASKTEMMLMAPKSVGGQGLTTNVAVVAPPWDGEMAFQQAVQILEGTKMPKATFLPVDTIASADVKVGTNPAEGANLFTASEIPPDFFPFWNPLVEQGLQAALHGTPDKISDAKPCSQVEGCSQK